MHAIDGMACAKRGCDNRGKLGLNIVGHGSFPTKWGRHWRYRCTVCGRTVSTTTGTAYSGLRCARREFNQVASLRVEGVSISAAKRIRRLLALVHDSKLTVNDPNPEASHRPILYDSGRPSSVIWFRTLHATTDSATRPPRDRARSRSPRIDLYRKNAFSTRAWSWEPASFFQRRRPSVLTSVIVRSRARATAADAETPSRSWTVEPRQSRHASPPLRRTRPYRRPRQRSPVRSHRRPSQ